MPTNRKKNHPEPIETRGGNIVCRDSKLKLSDERLKRLISHVYELARKDANKFHWYKHYAVFFSFGLTLFIALLTTNFKDFSFVKGQVLEKIAWIVFGLSIAIGIVLLFINVSYLHKNENDERDAVVEQAIKELIETKQ